MVSISDKKFKFKDYTFGFADSETEFNRRPDIFTNAFYDPKEILNKLLNSHEFILIGNKGVGKTAYSAKIRSLIDSTENLNAHQITLSDFEFDQFINLGKENFYGGQKFKISWDLTLLIEMFKFLNSSSDYTCVDSFYNIVEFLKANNLISLDSINNTVRSFNKLEINLLKFFKAVSEKKEIKLSDFSIPSLCDYMKKSLLDIDFNGSKNYLIIDGLDDILRYENSKMEILSGLFRSINHLNNYFYMKTIPLKIIILARADILNSISDPDFNKIKRDGEVCLSWNNTLDLKEIVNLRFRLSGVSDKDIKNQWNEIFPPKINRHDSFSYVVSHTLNKPRDILQFLEQCKKEYPNNYSLNYSELKYVMEQFSSFYFFSEMKNELSGFINDVDIESLELIFSDIGAVDFTFNRFRFLAEKYFTNKEYEYIRKLFSLLFDNGYIGQVICNPSYDKRTKKQITRSQAIFKHKNPTTKMNLANNFALHKGLYSAFNLK